MCGGPGSFECETQRLWIETQRLWIETQRLWIETQRLWLEDPASVPFSFGLR